MFDLFNVLIFAVLAEAHKREAFERSAKKFIPPIAARDRNLKHGIG